MSKRIKLSLNCRRIPSLDDDLALLHGKVKKFLGRLPEPWAAEFSGSPNTAPGELVAVCKLGRKGKFSGEACYSLRKEEYLGDESRFDDAINLDFQANEDEIYYFANEIFPELVSLFEAYRAELTTKDLARNDWREVIARTKEAKRDIYGRHGVYRIWPLSYYSSNMLNLNDFPVHLEPFFEGYMCKEIEVYLNEVSESYGKETVSS
ncbi:MAG: hypothetical protein JKY26_01420 [Pseudomonas sp.]|nr:hypothetical protein [Pseudomonas sp.]